MSTTKMETITSNFEVDFHDTQPKQRLAGVINASRVALTAVALAAAITILGLSADSLAVYNRTSISSEFLLPLWPRNFDIRPTTAMVATSTIITVAMAACLGASKVSSIRSNATSHMIASLAAPAVGFICALVAMSFFYGVNTSNTDDTFQSWTCRWQDVAMSVQPHFGTLCKESKVSLGLAVMLVPLQTVILGLATYQTILERKVDHTRFARAQKTSSPALS